MKVLCFVSMYFCILEFIGTGYKRPRVNAFSHIGHRLKNSALGGSFSHRRSMIGEYSYTGRILLNCNIYSSLLVEVFNVQFVQVKVLIAVYVGICHHHNVEPREMTLNSGYHQRDREAQRRYIVASKYNIPLFLHVLTLA